MSGLGKNPPQMCRFIECLTLKLFCILCLHYNLYNSRLVTLPDLKVGESFSLIYWKIDQSRAPELGWTEMVRLSCMIAPASLSTRAHHWLYRIEQNHRTICNLQAALINMKIMMKLIDISNKGPNSVPLKSWCEVWEDGDWWGNIIFRFCWSLPLWLRSD